MKSLVPSNPSWVLATKIRYLWWWGRYWSRYYWDGRNGILPWRWCLRCVVFNLTAILQKAAGLKNCQLMRPDGLDWWKSSMVRVKVLALVMNIARHPVQVLIYKHEWPLEFEKKDLHRIALQDVLHGQVSQTRGASIYSLYLAFEIWQTRRPSSDVGLRLSKEIAECSHTIMERSIQQSLSLRPPLQLRAKYWQSRGRRNCPWSACSRWSPRWSMCWLDETMETINFVSLLWIFKTS